MLPNETPTYLLLDSRQGRSPADGWQVLSMRNLLAGPDGLRLAPLPQPPTPLADPSGGFGGLENPTGVAVAPDGTIYVSDSQRHLIFKIVRRPALRPLVHFFSLESGPQAGDRYVYLPADNRLERWPAALNRDPQDPAEIELVCETVWSLDQAQQLVHERAGAANFSQTQGDYPAALPAGGLCDPCVEYLPCLGGLGRRARQLNQPHGLAVSPAGLLYVADSGNNRLQVFARQGRLLKAVWGRQDASPGSAPGQFNQPWDVAVDGDRYVYVADKGNQRLQQYDCRSRRFRIFDGTVLAAHFFQALYGPQAGERYVFIPARRRLERWPLSLGHDPTGILEVEILRSDVASQSAARELALEALNARGSQDILVEWEAAYPAALAAFPQPDLPFDSPAHLAVDQAGQVYVVDEARQEVKILDPHGRVLGRVSQLEGLPAGSRQAFRPTAAAIDSDGSLLLALEDGLYRYRVQGEAVSVEMRFAEWRGPCAGLALDATGRLLAVGGTLEVVAEIPAPTSLELSGSYLSRPLDSQVYHCEWHKIVLELAAPIPDGARLRVRTYTAEEPLDPQDILALDDLDWQTNQVNGLDFLVLSPPGRYLWLKIEFSGNGSESPGLLRLKAHFPRQTYLQYLPAVYQADPVSKDFLARFLSIFETILGGIELKIDHLWQYFDPDGVPADFLPWLASWVDMAFDPGMPLETRRRLLRHAPELYCRRGTPGGLKLMLELAFDLQANILEHFQLRRWLYLSAKSTLGGDSALWGNCIVGRLQLDENSRIGDFSLVGTGDPQRDPFHVYAHRFSVFIPASGLRSDAAERRVRYLIEAEKPAHTAYELQRWKRASGWACSPPSAWTPWSGPIPAWC